MEAVMDLKLMNNKFEIVITVIVIIVLVIIMILPLSE